MHCATTDDLNLVISKTEETVQRARLYFLRHELMMSASKTRFMLIGTVQLLSKMPTNIKIDFQDNIIEPVTNAQDLSHDLRQTYRDK